MCVEIESQARPDLRTEDRYWIHLYSGHCREVLGDLEGALRSYEQCVVYAPSQLEGVRSYADTSYRVATRSPGIESDRRKELLDHALESYRSAQVLIENAQSNLVTLSIEDLPVDQTLAFDRRSHNRTVLEFRKKYRRQRFELVIATARVESLIGDTASAIGTLEKGLADMRTFRNISELRPVEVSLRNLLGLFYEQTGQNLRALRQYRFVQKFLDKDDEQSRRAEQRMERARVGN